MSRATSSPETAPSARKRPAGLPLPQRARQERVAKTELKMAPRSPVVPDLQCLRREELQRLTRAQVMTLAKNHTIVLAASDLMTMVQHGTVQLSAEELQTYGGMGYVPIADLLRAQALRLPQLEPDDQPTPPTAEPLLVSTGPMPVGEPLEPLLVAATPAARALAGLARCCAALGRALATVGRWIAAIARRAFDPRGWMPSERLAPRVRPLTERDLGELHELAFELNSFLDERAAKGTTRGDCPFRVIVNRRGRPVGLVRREP